MSEALSNYGRVFFYDVNLPLHSFISGKIPLHSAIPKLKGEAKYEYRPK